MALALPSSGAYLRLSFTCLALRAAQGRRPLMLTFTNSSVRHLLVVRRHPLYERPGKVYEIILSKIYLAGFRENIKNAYEASIVSKRKQKK